MNGDSSITVHDVLILIKVLLNNQNVENGDLNGDGKVSMMSLARAKLGEQGDSDCHLKSTSYSVAY